MAELTTFPRTLYLDLSGPTFKGRGGKEREKEGREGLVKGGRGVETGKGNEGNGKPPPPIISYTPCFGFLEICLFRVQWRPNVVVSAMASINVVNEHQARLVLGWVTVCGQVNNLDITSHLDQLSLSSLQGR